MTIQLVSERFSKNKSVLQDVLNANPGLVYFHNPSFFLTETVGFKSPDFTGADIPNDEEFAVVMDPYRRTRFANVHRLQNGKFKVT